MKKSAKDLSYKFHPKHVSNLIETFLRDESIGGKLILISALISLLVVNSPLRDEYYNFWHLPFSLGFGDGSITLDLRHWINEGLMALFFLVVGLEVKREIVSGQLSDRKNAVLPIGAAIGGMIVPAFIYLLFNLNTPTAQGWGIPIATDIAFAVAVLSLLSKRVPLSLKVFLLTLAIVDDIGAIFVIALFYAEIINYWYLAASFILLVGIFLLRRKIVSSVYIVSLLGIVLWITTHLSGIHASIVGAALGLLLPVSKDEVKDAVLEKVEKLFLPITTFFILPAFAFANAGFAISMSALTSNQQVLWGIILGLVAGKMLGITIASWVLVKLNVARLPAEVNWRHIIGVGFIAGIGFTVSIFITELAFHGDIALTQTAKVSIFLASAISAILGYVILRFTKFNHRA